LWGGERCLVGSLERGPRPLAAGILAVRLVRQDVVVWSIEALKLVVKRDSKKKKKKVKNPGEATVLSLAADSDPAPENKKIKGD
jgi:hypothetical protein